jgi:hypothetical protein
MHINIYIYIPCCLPPPGASYIYIYFRIMGYAMTIVPAIAMLVLLSSMRGRLREMVVQRFGRQVYT